MGQIDNNSRIVKNTIYMSAQMVAGLFVSLYTSRVILQTLGVEDFGIYNVVAGFVSMFAFLNGSLINGTQRFFNYEIGKNGPDAARDVYNVSLRIQAIMAIAVFILVETVGLWYLNAKMVIPSERLFAAKQVFQYSVISMLLVILQVPFGAAIMAHEKMGFYALVNMIDVVLKLGIVLILPLLGGDKLVLYGILLLVISVLNFLLYSIYSYVKFDEIRIVRKSPIHMFKEMLSFSGWNAFGAFANMANGQGINMILNLFFGPVINAARGIAYQVNGAMQGLVGNVSVAIKPQLTQSYAQGDYQRTFSLMFGMSKISTLIVYALSLPLLLEISTVLHLWLGDVIPQYTAIFTILVVLTSVVLNLNGPVSFVVHATGKMRKYQVTCSLVSLMALPISYFVLKLGGNPVSVFLIVLFVDVIKQIVALLILRSITVFSIRRYINAVILPLLLFVLSTFFFPLIPYFLMNESILRLLIVILVSEIVILPAAYYVLMNHSEREMVLGYVTKIFHRNK